MNNLMYGSLWMMAAVGCAREPEVSWHADISPMMQQHCTRCHMPGGQGVGDFTDLDQVRSFSSVMAMRMADGQMPPPAADPSCRDYLGSEHMFLPEDKKDLFDQWMSLDMPEGNPELAPVIEPIPTELEDADLTLMMPEPYVPPFQDPVNPGNEYRCFILDHEKDEPFYITAFHPVVGEPALVHHIVLFLIDEKNVPETYDPAVGVDCINGRADEVGDIDGMIAGWAPGMIPVELDGGRGIRVAPNQRIVVQMHYFQKGPEVAGLADQSGYAMRTATSVQVPLLMAPLGLYDFKIPAGAEEYSASESITIPAGVSGKAHVVFPHMHVLGQRYRVWRERDGVQDCVVAGEYDFQNQLSYIFREPVELKAGDKLSLECTWNNSTSNPDRVLEVPVDTRYGERTDEEMCYAFTLLSIGG